jgi:hypothetical protein
LGLFSEAVGLVYYQDFEFFWGFLVYLFRGGDIFDHSLDDMAIVVIVISGGDLYMDIAAEEGVLDSFRRIL